MLRALGLLSVLVCLGASFEVFAGGVACAKICRLSNDFAGCCTSCAESCPQCLPCAIPKPLTDGYLCKDQEEPCSSQYTCPQTSTSDCRNVQAGTPCETYSLHGGKIDGECKWHTNLNGCGCIPNI